MKIALVGLGYWGPKLLRNLVELAGADQVVAVDNHVGRLEAVCQTYPTITGALTLEHALDDDAVRAVIVATPVETHAALASQAIDAGRHVLVEKPLAGSVAEARFLAERASDAGVKLMVGHTFLFSPRVARIADYLSSGALGKVQFATSSRLNLGLHRHDANVIWDLAPHDFSILFHLLGEFPVAVQTTARSFLRPKLPEVAFINLVFPSGAIASVNVSWLAPHKSRQTLIVGDSQMIEYDDTQSDEPIKIYDSGVASPDSADFGEFQLTYRYGDTLVPHVSAAEPLALQIAHFLDAIEHDTDCISDGWFGVRVVEALDAAHRSWELDGVSVEIGAVEAGIGP